LEETHTDAKRHEPMPIPSDILPINLPEYQMEVCAPVESGRGRAGCEKGKGFIISKASWSSECTRVLQEFCGNWWHGKNRLYLHSQKKRYKSCHWGCTFSKGTLL